MFFLLLLLTFSADREEGTGQGTRGKTAPLSEKLRLSKEGQVLKYKWDEAHDTSPDLPPFLL